MRFLRQRDPLLYWISRLGMTGDNMRLEAVRRNFPLFALALQTLIFAYLLKGQAFYDGPFKNDLHGHESYIELFRSHWHAGSLGLDAWDSQCCLGAAVFRTYQHLSHLGAAALAEVFGLSSALTLNLVLCFFLLLHGPSFYFASQILHWPKKVGVLAAWLSPLIVNIVLFGHQASSYLYDGYGVFTQAIAVPIFVLTLATIMRLFTFASDRVAWSIYAGLGLSLTFSLHAFLGYFILCLLGLFSLFTVHKKKKLVLILGVPALIFLLTNGYQLWSIWQDHPLMHPVESPNPIKVEGFGFTYVMRHLLEGDSGQRSAAGLHALYPLWLCYFENPFGQLFESNLCLGSFSALRPAYFRLVASSLAGDAVSAFRKSHDFN